MPKPFALSIARKRHAEHYLRVLQRTEQLLVGKPPHLEAALKLLDEERPNIEISQDWCRVHTPTDPEAAQWCMWSAAVGANVFASRFTLDEQIVLQNGFLAAARKLNNSEAEEAALANLANAHKNAGLLRTALRYHRQSLRLARKNEDSTAIGQNLANIGLDLVALNQLMRAKIFFQSWFKMATHENNSSSQARALNHWAIVERRLGNTEVAIALLQQALPLAINSDDQHALGNVLGNLGNALMDQGFIDIATGYLKAARDIHSPSHDTGTEIIALGNLGRVEVELRNWYRAIEYFKEQLTLAHHMGNRLDEGGALWNLAQCYYELGQLEDAIAKVSRALEILKNTEVPEAELHRMRATLAEWATSFTRSA